MSGIFIGKFLRVLFGKPSERIGLFISRLGLFVISMGSFIVVTISHAPKDEKIALGFVSVISFVVFLVLCLGLEENKEY